MEKKILEELLNDAVDTGAEFCDLFYESSITRQLILNDSKLDKINTDIVSGLGIRISDNDVVYYTSTNDLSYNNLKDVVATLKNNISSNRKFETLKLNELEIKELNVEKSNFKTDDLYKKNYLKNIDKIARSYDDKIIQVEAKFYEYNQDVVICNSQGKFVKTNRELTRLTVIVYAQNDKEMADSLFSFGSSNGYQFLEEFDIEKKVKEICKAAIEKLDAKPAPGGIMPVIVGNGFGVMIHEAVGHSLEATTVSKNVSVLSNKIGLQVASPIVTVVDDGTIKNSWGSILVDDEGLESKRNVCIENGILKGYLIDELNSRKMHMKATGSSRRENYHYAPTSRMTNTNLLPGNSSIDEMIKSIEYGLYAKVMGGGSVDPITGDFNFGVNEAYMIRNGKIAEMVKGASLLGNTEQVMQNIEMISDDFDADAGMCGSISGWVPVTCGQPTIKISSILVGGAENGK